MPATGPDLLPGLHLALVLLPAAVAAGTPGGPISYSCEFKAAGGDIVGDASVELRDGKVVKVHLSDFYAGLPGNLGYTCLLEAARDDGDTKWREVEGGVEIEFANSADWGDGNSMVVRPTVKGYVFDLALTKSSGMCGAGAALPAALTIVKTSKRCLFRLQQ
jgi:hypothetical protein